MKLLLIATLAIVASTEFVSDAGDFKFMGYITRFGKTYTTMDEYSRRKENFLKIDEAVARFNAEEISSVHDHNHFSDWTPEEFDELLGLMTRPNQKLAQTGIIGAAPTAWNWTLQGATVAPRDQGYCGAGYAFAATEVMESRHKLQYNVPLVPMSVQQYVSCSQDFGNSGCQGGGYFQAWDYTSYYALVKQTALTYTSWGGQLPACPLNITANGQFYSDFSYLIGYDDASIQNAVFNWGPNAAAIDASSTYFKTYKTGILTNALECGVSMNHAVVIDGYAIDATYGLYWYVRNSWGMAWGEQGYVRISAAGSPGKSVCLTNQMVGYVDTTQ